MKKILELMISLGLVAAVGTSMLGIGATDEKVYEEVNKLLVDAGASPIQMDLEETEQAIKENIVENEDGTIEVKDGLYEALEEAFTKGFENPVNELMSNFDI